MFAIDCRGIVTRIGLVRAGIEGGIVVAPAGFGPYGGDLIGADERQGNVYAITSVGGVRLVAHPSMASGQDIGVESVGFVPAMPLGQAYVADRGTPKSALPHPGTDSVLRLGTAALSAAGVRPGSLLVASEGAGTLANVDCESSCSSTVIATGPTSGHIEGHVVVLAGTAAIAPRNGSKATRRGTEPAIWWSILAVVAVLIALLAWIRRARRRSHERRPAELRLRD